MQTRDLKPGRAYLYHENDRGPSLMVYVLDNRVWHARGRDYSRTNPTPRTLSLTDDGGGTKGTPVLMIAKFAAEHELPEALLEATADRIRLAVHGGGDYQVSMRQLRGGDLVEVPEAVWQRQGNGTEPEAATVPHPVTVAVVNPRWIVEPWEVYADRMRRAHERMRQAQLEQQALKLRQRDRMRQIEALGRRVNVDLTLETLSVTRDKITVSSADLLRVLQALAAPSALTYPKGVR